jgi:glycosyltransferase involved in cell wall biosynthesis
MHTCLISTCLPQRCGIASYSHFLAEALCQANRGSRVTLLAEEGCDAKDSRSYAVVPAFRGEGDFPTEVMRRLAEFNADVVHIQHEYGIFGADNRFLDLLHRIRRSGLPVVVTLHTVHTNLSYNVGCARSKMATAFRQVDIERYQKDMARLSSRIVVHHDSAIRRVLLRQGCEADKVLTIPHGSFVSPPSQQTVTKLALAVPPEAPLLVSFGYFTRSKNLHVLINAFRRVKAKVPRARLWLGGHMKSTTREELAYRARCVRLIQDAGLREAVTFSSAFVDDEDLTLLLGAADICCFPYEEDTRSVSGAFHLALGSGNPVVASRIPKFQELGDVMDELLVNPRSDRELSGLLLRLLLDDAFRTATRKNLLTYAMETAWPRVACEHLAVYRELIRFSCADCDARELAA